MDRAKTGAGEGSSPKKGSRGNKRAGVILVVAGLALIVVPTALPSLALLFDGYGTLIVHVASAAFNAAGLSLLARRTGRSIVQWCILAIIFPLISSIVGLIVMLPEKDTGKTAGHEDTVHGADPGSVVKSGGPSYRTRVNVLISTIISLLTLFLSTVVFDSLAFGFLCFFVAVIWIATRSKDTYTDKAKLAAIGIYVLTLVMTFVLKDIHDRISYKNANIIIAACQKCKDETGSYPRKLEDLVPRYLTSLPVARYVIMSNGNFRYSRGNKVNSNKEDSYELMFDRTLFSKNVYHSGSKEWRVRDYWK